MIRILYEDRSILVCQKQPGVLSQAGPGPNLPDLLAQKAGGAVYPVHRLDREAGGVMVYARTRPAAAALSEAIRQDRLRKEYCCLVRGVPSQPEGIYEDLLLHDRTRNKSFVVRRMRGGVREARLSYRVLASEAGVSLVRVRLHTGRTHQIRVQFSSRGTPLLGDGKYGGGSGPLMLWSCLLAFPHPRTGEELVFTDLPAGGAWEPFRVWLPGDMNAAGQSTARPDGDQRL